MTRYTLSVQEDDLNQLRAVLAANPGVENGAYLLVRLSRTSDETRLLVTRVIPIAQEHILEASPHNMKIASASFRAAMKLADREKSGFVFVHTHPAGHPAHSRQDDAEEATLFGTAYNRIHSDVVHASMVLIDGQFTAGRVWLPDGSHEPLERIRTIGRRFDFWFAEGVTEISSDFYDRQVRAFGPVVQSLLKRLCVGVVGAGGTGSAVIAELSRLGVGTLIVADGETFEASNVNRLYGSRVSDAGKMKVAIAERSITEIGLETVVDPIDKPITFRSAAQALRGCDVIFGCTDDQWGRSILARVAVFYGIPVFDMGVSIDSQDGVIRSIQGRVTTLMPGTACLFCRARISAEGVGDEMLWATDPEKAKARVAEGYARELDDPAPAVIPFTTTVAASAVSEMLDRLVGFSGTDAKSSELLHLFDRNVIRRNSKASLDGCFCSPGRSRLRGDVVPFLDLVWRTE